MLSSEDTDLLCRVGADTPMGKMMRQYWLPFGYSWEYEENDQPQRIRLLGEDLIVWRSSEGELAVTQPNCPHRGVNFFYGRNEESGIRCAYHGWKFDISGQCIEMPNEPAESNFKYKVKIKSYRCADFGGVAWVYMGADQLHLPQIPQFEWGLLPEENVNHAQKIVYECNWMQALEGELDSTHVYFLHRRLDPSDSPRFGLYHNDMRAKFHIVDKEYGFTYGAERTELDGNTYWRTTQFLFPFYGMFPAQDGVVPLSIYVPIDDYHTLHMGIWWKPSGRMDGTRRPSALLADEIGALSPGVGPMKDEQHGKFFSHWWPKAALDSDFLVNARAKKTKNMTGIPTVRLQDSAVIHSMGPIMDRTKEHLGTTDASIIRARRSLIRAAVAFEKEGKMPPGSENPEMYFVRSCATILEPNLKWEDALENWHNCKTNEFPRLLSESNRAFEERILPSQ
tara:strand:+ start:307 stop:1662 length:1356 start_codon:yes stop_codon:yes gene_type:complete